MSHTTRRALIAALLVVGLLASPAAAGATAAPSAGDVDELMRSFADGSAEAAQNDEFEVIADGLTGPRGVDIDEEGSVFVIESGVAEEDPEGPCVTQVFEPDDGEPEEATLCYMETGAVVRVMHGEQEAVVSGLPAVGVEGQTFGPSDVSISPRGDIYAIIGLGGDEELRDSFGPQGQGLGSLWRAQTVGGSEYAAPAVSADIAAYEFEHNPDQDHPGSEVDSNPYGVVAEEGRQLVVDAGGNTMLAANDAGDVTLEAVFPTQLQTVPPGLPDEGEEVPAQSVPTGVTIGPDGAAYVTEFPGGFGPDGSARVWRVDTEDSTVEVYEDGFTAAMDLEFGPDGSLYVLQLVSTGEFEDDGPPPSGRLVRVTPDGDREIVAEEGLIFPTGMAIGSDGIYVSNCSLCPPEAGQVVRIDFPGDEGACPPAVVPPAGFTDVPAGSVHRPAIDCLAWWEISLGVTPTTYRPAGRLTRAQMASFLARAILASEATLHPNPPDAFTDDLGSVHEAAINALAHAGILQGTGGGRFSPRLTVTRDQMATMLVRATEYVLEAQLPATRDHFTDDDGSVHEDNINKAAEAGIARGVTETLFNPRAQLRRDQAASFVARMIDVFVTEGRAEHP